MAGLGFSAEAFVVGYTSVKFMGERWNGETRSLRIGVHCLRGWEEGGSGQAQITMGAGGSRKRNWGRRAREDPTLLSRQSWYNSPPPPCQQQSRGERNGGQARTYPSVSGTGVPLISYR